MNTRKLRLSGCIAFFLAAGSITPVAPAMQSDQSVFTVPPGNPSLKHDQKKAPVSAELDLQTSLSKEALQLRLRQREFAQLEFKLRSEGKPVGFEIRDEMNVLELRRRAIADQLFSLSGDLSLDALEPGDFAGYIAECLKRINNAVAAENPEMRRRFYGRTASVRLDLVAEGKIESIIPYSSKQDKEFGDYLHDLIWKVPSFPKVPQLKTRRIERVSISFSFTLQSGQHDTRVTSPPHLAPMDLSQKTAQGQ
ncbi:MAG: hypothetical protein V4484_19080 [Pseudomonadota bacterium]